MKKMMICTAAVLLALTGCSKKSSAAASVSEESTSSGMITMSAAGFTDNQAETLMTSVVSEHCAKAGIACEVTAAQISGNDVIANYQYAKGGKVAYANAVITEVSVNADNLNEVTYVSAKFEDGSITIDNGTSEEAAEEETDDSIPKFDVPSTAPDLSEEGATDDVTLVSESGVRLHRIYVTRTNFVADGTYDGNGRMRVVLMDLNQKVEQVAVDQQGAGEFHTVTPITEGFHYMLLIVDDGGWELQWSALPDDMIDQNN